MKAMTPSRRTFVVAGLVLLVAALGWYRLAPGQPPAGQPPLVTIDAEALQGLKADFNRNGIETRVIVLLSPT